MDLESCVFSETYTENSDEQNSITDVPHVSIEEQPHEMRFNPALFNRTEERIDTQDQIKEKSPDRAELNRDMGWTSTAESIMFQMYQSVVGHEWCQ